jgi:hypothetical protein
VRGGWQLLGLCAALLTGPARADPVRVEGVSAQPRDRISIYTVRGEGVSTPLVAFQERAGRLIEAHMHAEIVSMREILTRGGPALHQGLAGCQADAKCYADLLGAVEARYLLIIIATHLGDLRLVGARLLDLQALEVLGESIEAVPGDGSYLDALEDRVRACIPAERWDPFGGLEVAVSEPGAQVTLQGRVVGLSPLGEVGFLMPGTYRVGARKAGFDPVEVDVEVRARARTPRQLDLHETASPGGGSVWIWVGVGAAVAAAATVTAVVLTSGGGDPTFCSAASAESCR